MVGGAPRSSLLWGLVGLCLLAGLWIWVGGVGGGAGAAAPSLDGGGGQAAPSALDGASASGEGGADSGGSESGGEDAAEHRSLVSKPDCCVVYGSALGRGAPLAERWVRIGGQGEFADDTVASVQTSVAGTFRFEVPPGRYFVAMATCTEGVIEGGGRWRPGSTVSSEWFEIQSGEHRVDLEAPPGHVDAAVLDGRGVGVPGVEVLVQRVHKRRDIVVEGVVVGSHRVEPDQPDRVLRTDVAGRVAFEELRFGLWSVTVKSPVLAAVEPQQIDLTKERPTAALTFATEPAAHVRLAFVDSRDQPARLESAFWSTLKLRRIESGVEFEAADSKEQVATVLEFHGLPSGEYEVVHTPPKPEGRGLSFSSFALTVPDAFEAKAGVETVEDVRVRLRPRVRVRAVKRRGNFAFTARLAVTRVSDGVRVAPGPWHDGATAGGYHFDGYLEPGTYLLRFASKDGESWQEPIRVDAQTNVHRVRLPW